MKFNFKNNALYWKCQLIGWTLYVSVPICFAIYIDSTIQHIPQEPTPITYYLGIGLKIVAFGAIITHLMREVIKVIKVLEKPVWQQVLYFFVFTICFTMIYQIAFLISMFGVSFFATLQETFPQRRLMLTLIIQGLTFFAAFVTWYLIYFIYHYMQKARAEEQQKATLKIQMLELEAKALRAQMNPHFIFNCMNSIKSLMQEGNIEKGITYLTTFSKLIRTLLNNADKKEISLYDEIETCKLYLQLEAMRFDTKFSYAVNVDENIDLKSIQIPALIVQPFIENAIWHGIMPHNSTGHVSLNVLRKEGIIEVVIDDDGIGREASQQNKSTTGLTHQSKGVNLTQARLELNNLLQQRQAALEVIDKNDEHGVATGTTIIIKIKEELL